MMVRDFQTVIGRETREQILEKPARLPDVLSRSVGAAQFDWNVSPFLRDESVRMIGLKLGAAARVGQPRGAV